MAKKKVKKIAKKTAVGNSDHKIEKIGPSTKGSSPLKFNFSTDIRVRRVLVAMIIISIGILLGTMTYTIYKIIQYGDVIKHYSVNASVEVTSMTIGLNVDKGVLNFGKATQGGGATRYIDINTSQEAMVDLYISGNIAEYVTIEKNGFYIAANTSERIPVTLIVPSDLPLGQYHGVVTVVMTKP